MRRRLLALVTALCLCAGLLPVSAQAASRYPGFETVTTRKTDVGTYHLLRHTRTGAQVVWLDNGSEMRSFRIGFRTPPTDSKGANHVLEHALLCGSTRYPARDLMHILRGNTLAVELNAYTSEDFTSYAVTTAYETEFYNLLDVYADAVLHPMLLKEPNIFRQQGVRLELVDGKLQYNGVVFQELQLRSLQTAENALDALGRQLYVDLYGADSTPAYVAGGALPDLTQLTYDDLLRVYRTCYVPQNMLVYTAGQQDIGKTLSIVHRALNGVSGGSRPQLTLHAQANAQPEQVHVHQVQADTKTVDIGFLAEGPQATDLTQVVAWNALADYVQRRLQQAYPDTDAYMSGGLSGGISSVAPILSGVPKAQYPDVIQTFRKLLDEIARNGIPQKTLDELVDTAAMAVQFDGEDVLTGFVYADDPLACLDRDAAVQRVKSDPQVIGKLAAYWRDTDRQVVTVYGAGGAAPSVTVPDLSAAQREQVARETDAFAAWVARKTPESVLARIPQLSERDFADDPFTARQTVSAEPDVTWYHTEADDGQVQFALRFPLEIRQDDLFFWGLLCEFLNQQGGPAYFGLDSGEQADDPNTLRPSLILSGVSAPDQLAQTLDALARQLRQPPLQDAAALHRFLVQRQGELKRVFADPYQTEYDLMLLGGSQAERLLCGAPVGFVGSSLSFRDGVDAAVRTPEQDAARLDRMRTLLTGALRRGGVSASLTGTAEDLAVYQRAVRALLASLPQGTGKSACETLTGGAPSALVVSSGTQDSNHVMLRGELPREADRAVLRVMAGVLTSKYVLPVLRDSRGAYGAGVNLDTSALVFACAGSVPVDEVLAVYQGAGDWLRTLEMTERELTGYKLRAVCAFDEESQWTRGDGAALAIAGQSQKALQDERARILSVTVRDIRACAGLLDAMYAQGRVYAQTTAAQAGAVRFPFAQHVTLP